MYCAALRGTGSGIDEQRPLRSHDQSEVHRFRLGNSDVHTGSQLPPWPECGRRAGFGSRCRRGHHARLALCLCECQTFPLIGEHFG